MVTPLISGTISNVTLRTKQSFHNTNSFHLREQSLAILSLGKLYIFSGFLNSANCI